MAVLMAPDAPVPLVVDMDGTLLRTDTLLESLLALARLRPLALLKLPLWLSQGRAAAKQHLARRAALDVATLPVHEGLVPYLQAEKRQGRPLVLATGADTQIARAVADRLGLFDEVLASDGQVNLTGEHKRDRLVARYGERGYDYVGNSLRDLPVLSHARHGLLVNPSPALMPLAQRAVDIERVFETPRPKLSDYLGAMRVHHGLKNLLLLIAPLFGQRLGDLTIWGHALIGMLCFNLAAYGVYLLNDLLDLPADRRHPHKRQRALACGQLPISHALLLIPALWLAAAALSAWLAPTLLVALGVYLAMMLAYSLRLKDLAFVDALVLALGYTLRLLAGALATGVALSPWLLVCSTPLFFGLALLKRYAELVTLRPGLDPDARVRAYRVGDGALIAGLGVAACCVAVAILALYPVIEPGHGQRWALWPVSALLLFWMSHMWLMAHRGNISGDPVSFALHNRVSRVFALLMLAALALTA